MVNDAFLGNNYRSQIINETMNDVLFFVITWLFHGQLYCIFWTDYNKTLEQAKSLVTWRPV